MATIDSVKLPDNSTYDLTDNYSGYQKQTLATPITVDGTSETTVEGALGAVNDYADKIDGSMSNGNLLLNPFFTINERGATSGTTAVNAYAVDRWATNYGSAIGSWSLDSSGLTLTPASGDYCYISQAVKNSTQLNGKTVTLSALLSDGTIVSGSIVRASGTTQNVEVGNVRLVYNSSEKFVAIALNGQAVTFRAVKLELGSISTLANDVAPDYALELAKCQTSTADPSDTYANQGQLMTSALQGVYGAVNGFDEKTAIVYNMTNNNGVFTNTIADARNYVDLYIWAVDGAFNPTTLVYTALTSTGNYSFNVTVPSGTKYIDVRHNSSTDDQVARFPVSMSGACKVSFRLLGANPSIVGGFSFDNAMFCDARVVDDTFVPFAKTNKQLTDDTAGMHNNQIASNNIIDISSYTSTSNPFEAPADGYAVLNAQTTPSGISSLTIYGSDMSTSSNFTVTLANPAVNYQGTSAFVRKGMHVVCSILQVGHVAYYFPLT